MAKSNYTSVDQYIATQPESAQKILKQVRNAIRKGVPRAEEVISYQIPAYKVDGRVTIYFAGWKEHYSIYPAGARMVAAFKKELAPYEVNNKGTIRFPYAGRIPTKLISDLARFRAKEVAELAKKGTARQKSTSKQ